MCVCVCVCVICYSVDKMLYLFIIFKVTSTKEEY